MGEAKRRKDRLGPWHGKEVAPGHPDWREPPRRERPAYDRDRVRGESAVRFMADPAEPRDEPEERVAIVGAPEAETAPTAPAESPPEPKEERPAAVVVGGPGMRRPARALGMLGMVALLSTVLGGTDLGPPPEPRRKR